MARFIRSKRVSDPLDDKVKARLMTGYASSGSEHGADDSCLSSLVHAFFDLNEEESASDDAKASSESASDDDDGSGRSRIAEAVGAAHDVLESSKVSDPFVLRLRTSAVEAAEVTDGLRSNGSGCRRRVMARLREAGYNAGICKAKWESRGGLTAGNYQYIDVVAGQNDDERYIVDLDFASQFVIARSTPEYEELVALLPEVIVARAETVRRLVRVMAEAAKMSLKSKDLSLPPWRKRRYMLAKWFGPYRRTINPLPTAAGASIAARGDVQCRAVGFESASRLIIPPMRGTG